MKSKMIISCSATLLSILCALALSACSNPEAEAKIQQLTGRNGELVSEIRELNATLDSLKVKNDSLAKVLGDLDMAPAR